MEYGSDSEDDDLWEINCKPCPDTTSLSPRSTRSAALSSDTVLHKASLSSTSITSPNRGAKGAGAASTTRPAVGSAPTATASSCSPSSSGAKGGKGGGAKGGGPSSLDIPLRGGANALICSHSRSTFGSSRNVFFDSPEYAKYGDTSESDRPTAAETTTLKGLTTAQKSSPAVLTTTDTKTQGGTRSAAGTRTDEVADATQAPLQSFTHIKREVIHKANNANDKCRKFVMEYIPNMRRPYYRIYLPQKDQFQLDNFLFCRKKRNQKKFRFSLSEKMTKKHNPMYEGKLTILSESRTERAFRLTDRLGNVLGEMNTVVSPEAHQINVLIFPHDSTTSADGKPIELKGTLQQHIDPRLMLKCNGKHILEMDHPSDHAAEAHHSAPPMLEPGGTTTSSAPATMTSTRKDSHKRSQTTTTVGVGTFEKSRSHRMRHKRAHSYQGNRQNKFTLEWVAPLSMFTSFAIACVAEDCIQAEARTGDGTYHLDGKK